MQNVRFNPAAVVTRTAAGVLIRSDLGTFQLSGADIADFVEAVIPLLNGHSSSEQIADSLPQYSKDSVVQLLDTLRARGIVQEAPRQDVETSGAAEFFRAWSLDPAMAAERLRSSRVLLVGLEPWGVEAAVGMASAGVGNIHVLDDDVAVGSEDLSGSALWRSQDLGSHRAESLARALSRRYPACQVTFEPLRLETDGTLSIRSHDFQLIAACLRADELRILMALARFGHNRKIPSLYGHIEDFSAVAGPLVIPGQTPCWNCTRLRILGNAKNAEVTHALQASLLQQRPQSRLNTYLAPMTSLLGQLLSIESLKHISRFSSSTLTGHQLLQNLISLESRRHAILRMPWCEVCGGASQQDALLQQGPEASTIALDDASSPEQLRQMLGGVIDERTGLISQVAVHPAETDDPELPITCSAVLCSYTEGHYHNRSPEIGSGKALSTVRAIIGSVGEALERYSAARYRKKQLLRAQIHELEGDTLDPAALALYRPESYADPAFPCRPFERARPLDWVRGRWLHSREQVWIPALPVFFNFHAPREEQFCQVSSNGLAAGPDPEDAAWRATFELMERDTFMLSWLARRSGRRVLLDGALDSEIREVVRQLERTGAGLECCALDIGTGIPVVTCLAWGDGNQWPGVTVSIAAHRSWKGALEKSILEQGHVGPYIRRLSKQEGTKIPSHPEEVRELIDHALYYVDPAHAAELAFLGAGGEISYSQLTGEPELSGADCLELLDRAKLRIAIADVTSPDLLATPFRVARALGQYIQQIDFGYHMRRLANPRLAALLQGREPNPAPHPIA